MKTFILRFILGVTFFFSLNTNAWSQCVLECTFEGEFEISCANPETTISVSCTGGVAPYFFQWSTGDNTSEVTINAPGIYTLTVFDQQQCAITTTLEIVETNEGCGLIQGQVMIDDNENCNLDDDLPLNGWMVQAVGDLTYYGYTDGDGTYDINVLPGDYEVNLINPDGNLWAPCDDSQNVFLADITDVATADFAVQKLLDCAFMEVELGTPFLRRCFDGSYSVSYCNLGTITADDVAVDVSIPDLIEVTGASIDYTNNGDGTYTFDIGSVNPGECGSFAIDIYVSCDAELGQTLCSEATITPNDPCIPPSASWSGASVALEVSCDDSEVNFLIQNIGTGNMVAPAEYIVFEDGVMLMSVPGTFQLENGQEEPISLPANGSTYVLQADQEPFHPGNSMPSLAIEGCGTNGTGGVSTGIVNQFPLDEGDPFISIDCHEVIGAWDPNDKQAFPEGYSDENYIERGQDIEYLIRFQNTGTDTAFNVIIEDVISEHLDITTLRTAASSHSYEIEILGSDTLHFVFENIMLPDSNVNEAASHGFVQFYISQKADLPLETVIENTAGIFFDFNEAVITNTVFHTIGEDFFPTNSTEVFIPNVELEVYPNPFEEFTTFDLNGIGAEEIELQVYDMNGQLKWTQKEYNSTFRMYKRELPAGMYFYQISTEKQRVAAGKLIIE